MAEFLSQPDEGPFEEPSSDSERICALWWNSLSFEKKLYYKEHPEKMGPPLVEFARNFLKEREKKEGITVEEMERVQAYLETLVEEDPETDVS